MNSPTMKFTLMQHQQAGSVPAPGKSYLWNGKLEKDVVGSYTHLRAKTIETDLKGLVKLIRSLDGNSHLVAGISTFDEVDVMPAGNGVEGKFTIPRTNESFPFAANEHGMLTIDSDGMGGPVVWQQITTACPLLAGHARVEASSSSSNIHAPNGAQLTGEKGQHTYLHAADASDIPRALVVLHQRLILSGFACYKLSAVGAILERSAVDTQLRVSSQPIYIHPTLFGVTQQKRVEFFEGVEVIDTRVAIPDLTPEEHHAFAKADAIARASLKDEAEEVAEAYDEERGKTLPGGAAEARAARQGNRLPAEWEIILSNGTTVTVGAILADPKEYHGKACRDPLEVDYGGKTVAKIYSDQEVPMINSHAHGGRSFHMGSVDIAAMFDVEQEQPAEQGPRSIFESFIRRPFPLFALPPMVAAAVMDVQYHVQCPVALAVGSALTAMSLVAMGHVDAVRSATLTGPCGLIVVESADSGERKTAADKWFTAGIHAHELKKEQDYQISLAFFEKEMRIWKVKEAAVKRAEKKDGASLTPSEVEAKYRAFLKTDPVPRKPVRQKTLYNAATSEVMYTGIGRWPLMAILSNEGGTFFGSRAMSAESSMATLALLNSMWDGERIMKDTKGNGEDFCARPRGSAHLMAQEGIFRSFLDANGGQAREIGAIARFLMCQPETTRGTRFFREDGGTFGIDTFNQRIGELIRRPVVIDEDGVLVTRLMHLSPEAKAAWIEYYNKVEKLVTPGEKYSGLSDIASKSAENAARLATVFAFTTGDEIVSVETMRGACLVAEWYLEEMLVYLGDGIKPTLVRDAEAVEHCLLTRCLEEKRDYTTHRNISSFVSPRELRRDHTRIDAALALLVSKGRVKVKEVGTSLRVHPHPVLLADAMSVMGRV